jgi:hypothetical protein
MREFWARKQKEVTEASESLEVPSLICNTCHFEVRRQSDRE